MLDLYALVESYAEKGPDWVWLDDEMIACPHCYFSLTLEEIFDHDLAEEIVEDLHDDVVLIGAALMKDPTKHKDGCFWADLVKILKEN